MPWHSYGGPCGFPWLVPFLFIAFGVFALWIMFGRNRAASPCSPGGGTAQSECPLDIAKRRYAKGEISKDEFEEIKRTIS